MPALYTPPPAVNLFLQDELSASQVDGVPVGQVFRHADGRVLHALPSVPADPSKVVLSVDWGRRFDHMQQHTGARPCPYAASAKASGL
jgi:Ser-tRNA(Ala) deacylase AlaX